MYKFLLCWRYLRTRYIALASIISVMLGVATMIVVNSVMAGFTHEMRNRIHGILSDIVFEAYGLEGFPDANSHMQRIQEVAGDSIEGMTPTVHVPGLLTFEFRGQPSTRQIMFIGIDERTHSQVSDFGKYLQHPLNREHLSFDLRDGYDTRDHQMGPEALPRTDMEWAGWKWRQYRIDQQRRWEEMTRPRGETTTTSVNPFETAQGSDKSTVPPEQFGPLNSKPSPTETTTAAAPVDPFQKAHSQEPVKRADPAHEQFTGVIMGIGLASVREKDGSDHFLLLPGDDVKVTFPTPGLPPKIQDGAFTVVDFYESKMSEYDNSFVFVPLRELQRIRGMIDPQTGVANVSSIQIKLKPGVDADVVRDKLRAAFPGYLISTWQDKQGPLLAAVQMESAVLNILLFMIIAVAGFGILATFFMIVVEKTRDIGIMKSLGASARGILGIFLAYGLSLGIVGSGVGCVIGLLFVRYINTVRTALEAITGQKVFDPSIYYFYKIPTIVDPFTVGWIVVGALLIAVLASVLPALRAATLHPVEALRYE
ncbi:MAG TPA: ABC transporter permease [Pirellulales bacterium]|nr:ABC transporter permease [Pirellulales bacterium]